jgi:hypothetical protein
MDNNNAINLSKSSTHVLLEVKFFWHFNASVVA